MVAAGQGADRRGERLRFGAQLAPVAFGHLLLRGVVDDAAGGDLVQGCSRGVGLDVLDEVQSEHLAVLGDVGQTVVDGLPHGGGGDLLAVLIDVSGDVGAPGAPEQAHGQFRASGSHEASEPDDLSAPQRQGGVVDDGPGGVDGVVSGPVFDPEHFLLYMRSVFGEPAGQLAPHHETDDLVLVDGAFSVQWGGADGAAVPDDGGAVGDTGHLRQLVGDHHHGDAAFAQPPHEVEQVGGVVVVEGGGGLIENEQAHVFGQGLGDLHQLLLADAEVRHTGLRTDVQADLLKQFGGHLIGGIPVDYTAGSLLVAHEDVLGHRQVRAECQLLVDDDDAEGLGVADRAEFTDLAVVDDVAVIGTAGPDPGQHVHQGGFAGAVLAADGQDLAATDLQVDVIQGLEGAEGLGYVPHLQNRVRGRRRFLRGRGGTRGLGVGGHYSPTSAAV